MKQMVFIHGAMGVGKTAAARSLQGMMRNCVFLDGDWCWDMEPFIVTDVTRRMVLGNIGHALRVFLGCPSFESIIFCWVMHKDSIIRDVLERIGEEDYRLSVYNLVCSPEELARRIGRDVMEGRRREDVLSRSMSRMEDCHAMDTIKIDVGQKSAGEAAAWIRRQVESPVRVRPYRPADCGEMADVFYQAVHAIRGAYTEGQLFAWADGKVGVEAWDQSFREHKTVVAERGGRIVGFGDIRRDGYLDRLYVHPDFQRQGIASVLCDCLESCAPGMPITTYAAINAKGFFEGRGYRGLEGRRVMRRGIWLMNHRMERPAPEKR